MQGKLEALSLFLFPLGQACQATGKVFIINHHYSAFFHASRGPPCRSDQYYKRVFSPCSEAGLRHLAK